MKEVQSQKALFRLFGLLTVLFCLGLSTAAGQGIKYDSLAKRDPFISLVKKENTKAAAEMVLPPPLEKRPPGLAGLLISETEVTGTATGPERVMVILRGIDDVTYFASEGSKLFDGYLEKINAEQIQFKREQVDTRGKKHVSSVVKRIQTEDR
jgi:hypothetical protein